MQIKKSVNEAVNHYTGELDVIYLYCNKDITETCDSYKEIIKILTSAGIKMELVTCQTILDQAMNYPPVLSCFFGLDSLDDEWFQKILILVLKIWAGDIIRYLMWTQKPKEILQFF